MENPSEFVREHLLWLPEGQLFTSDMDISPYYRKWGFTIYRTAYGPGSDQCWQTIIDKINAQVSEDALDPRSADPAAHRAVQLFRLDARSDRNTLEGLNADQVRELYKNAVGGQPMNADDRARRVFLLVDEEVIEATSLKEFWVKGIQVDYAIGDYTHNNRRLGSSPRYFGWMKLAIRSVPHFWASLYYQEMEDIAPETIGGAVLSVWDCLSSY
ncbi:hypothetical protein DM02DRAFT_60110 [Periconia macrospinosa]|uniref:Uncharacterized protein n=1 Tax=Periconia macrospinosa TaxID=97972 RepID=A0A2V1DLH9_9PLEO|nr:hypothetical protein DM02DRAFT_60110 [Periconia macrospinosa]